MSERRYGSTACDCTDRGSGSCRFPQFSAICCCKPADCAHELDDDETRTSSAALPENTGATLGSEGCGDSSKLGKLSGGSVDGASIERVLRLLGQRAARVGISLFRPFRIHELHGTHSSQRTFCLLHDRHFLPLSHFILRETV